MIKQLCKYIQARPFMWSIGLLLPALASFTVNFGFSLSLNYYTVELTRENALFRNVLILMIVTAISLVTATVIEDIARYIFRIFIVKTQNKIKFDLYQNLINTKYSLLDTADRGEFYTNYNSDSEIATKLISDDLFAILFPLIHAVGYFIALLIINTLIGILVIGLTIAIMILNHLFLNQFKQLERKVLIAREDFTRMTDSTIRGKITIRQLQIGDTIANLLAKKTDTLYQIANRKVRIQLYRKASLELLATICTSLITPIACLLAASNIIRVASIVMIAQICRFIVMQTSSLGVALQDLGVHAISYHRLQKILQLPNEYEQIEDSYLPISDDTQKAAILFTDFGISYNDDLVLHHVNAQINSGEITALIGPSGSGKTSVISALLGLIDYTGNIQFYGTDVKKIKIKELRNYIAYSPEHAELFEDASIIDNLLYVAPNKTKNEILNALDSLSLNHIDIHRKPSTLSGGERLRVSLARVILRDAKIVILDEPTAALDSESETIVLQILDILKQQGKAIILVSHRDSTIQNADRYLTISNHQIYQL